MRCSVVVAPWLGDVAVAVVVDIVVVVLASISSAHLRRKILLLHQQQKLHTANDKNDKMEKRVKGPSSEKNLRTCS